MTDLTAGTEFANKKTGQIATIMRSGQEWLDFRYPVGPTRHMKIASFLAKFEQR